VFDVVVEDRAAVEEDQVAGVESLVLGAWVPRLGISCAPGPNSAIAYARRGSPVPGVFVPRSG
jgi:hypothetical protein